MKPKAAYPALWRLMGAMLVCLVALQLFFGLRILAMRWIDPESTAFERSEAWRLLQTAAPLRWRQAWADEADLSPHLRRAVIASEDAGFADHAGVEWDAIEKAWERNQKAEARAQKQAERNPKRPVSARLVGGSTITQQLAKNLFLSGERTPLRKGQELVLTYMLETLLDKRRILTLYLNHVELGEGVFGAEAAAQHYFRTSARQLQAAQAARLAVMLPAPKRYEKTPQSPYLAGRSAVVLARMPAVEVP